MARTISVEYVGENKKSNKGTGSEYNRKSVTDQLSAVIADAPVAKLYLIFLMIIYGVVVYSKGKIGVKNDDVAALVFFALFVIGSVSTIEGLTLLKRRLMNEFKMNLSTFGAIKQFLNRYFVPAFFSIGLFSTLVLFWIYSGKIIAKILWFLSRAIG